MQPLYHTCTLWVRVHGTVGGWRGGWWPKKILKLKKTKQAGWLSVCQDGKGQNETKVQQNDPVIANSRR